MGDDLTPPITTQPLEDTPQGAQRLPHGSILEHRYLIEEVVGSGGMGAVYRARDLHFSNVTKWVAVKEMANMNEDPAGFANSQRNFQREANLLATLSHPSIPHIYDFFAQGAKSYLVMDFIAGQNLEKILKQTNEFLPEEQVLQWGIELCTVLDYLHTHTPEPVVFRDIKPSNIIINPRNQVVLVDFGIARAFKTGEKGTVMGTEGYSPPEQYRGEYSPKVDIYALGATLHHLLTRKNPQIEAPFTFLDRPVRQYNPGVSREFEAVVEKAVQYDPDDRYQSASDMLDALLRVKRSDHPGGNPSEARKSPEPTRAANTVAPLWKFECEDEIRGAPVVSQGMVLVGSYDNNLYALDQTNGEFLWKFPTAGAIVGRPALDEVCTYIGSLDGRIYAILTHTHKPIWTVPTDGPVCSSPALLGHTLLIGSDDGCLYALNTETGSRLWRYETAAPVRSTPAVHRRNIFFGNEAGDFYCLDLFGKQKWHYRAKRAVTSSPFVDEQLALFASMDASLYAFDSRMGWEQWRFRMTKGSISSPCMVYPLVYLGAIDGNIYCVDARNGREVWAYRTGHQVTGSPSIVGGFLFCGSVDGYLYCLDAKNGGLVWKYQTGGPITGGLADADGVVYCGSVDHCLYAFPA